MNKTAKFFSIIIVFLLIIVWTAKVQASGCVTGTITQPAAAGQPATLSVYNGAGCGAQYVSFCSYRVYIANPNPGWLATQTLFDQSHLTINPGETRVMTVDTDNCQGQVDGFVGDCPTFDSDNTSVSGIFAGTLVNTSAAVCAKCTDECAISGQRVCDGSGWKQCGNYDNDSCLEWSMITNCALDQRCDNGACLEKQPTVDLNASGLVSCNQSAVLTWTSTDTSSCYASGGWSGSRPVSGSETVGNFTGSRTYTLICSNNSASASDSVTLYGTQDNLNVDAGLDEAIDEGDSVRLGGRVDGDYSRVRWSCDGGSLSDDDILRPTFRVRDDYDYSYDYDRNYTCTLTAYGNCGSDSDSMTVRVRRVQQDFRINLSVNPSSGCVPLNGVDLTATLSDYGSYRDDAGSFAYYFDCNGDSEWDKTYVTRDTSYTAHDLCNYPNGGNYTVRVRVDRAGYSAYDTATVNALSCGKESVSTGATVKVYRQAVLGATTVSTGIGDNTAAKWLFAVVILAALGAYLLRGRINPTAEELLARKIQKIRARRIS